MVTLTIETQHSSQLISAYFEETMQECLKKSEVQIVRLKVTTNPYNLFTAQLLSSTIIVTLKGRQRLANKISGVRVSVLRVVLESLFDAFSRRKILITIKDNHNDNL